MYNLLISGNDTAWDLPAYEFHRTRYLEYTIDSIRDAHGDLSTKVVADLKSYPALFMYEQYEKNAQVGYIRDIKERGNSLYIEYEFDPDIEPIPGEKIAELAATLQIEEYRGEQYRTHWAIKSVDLLGLLNTHGLVSPELENEGGPVGRLEEMKFKVAFSFPGELREYVEQVSNAVKLVLPAGSVFYDNDFVAQLARPNLDTLLQTVYLKNSDLIVVFLSSDYEKKMWCGIEWRAVRSFINSRNDETVMFFRADDASIPGVFAHDGYVDMAKFPPEQSAKFVLERVRLLRGDN
ncbi:TIR domain-containing protein [Aeromonas hydrophila]|uniref:TIR domain-containing protein n=1 Tax=Aeromonas hydrophila TaxID=644 RepID=UPI00214F4508|nr:TIR domain-containing protein [Aeromonas hydrophila]MCR3949791.1 TIR domain-containing protein [Aeromonas hydrophila]MCW4615383.1 TIR domain-containing protein [Aeromonas hydrophila]